MEKWRDTDAEEEVTLKDASTSQSCKAEIDRSNVSETEVF